MMMMMHARPSAVRMEGGGAATCGFANLIGGQFRVSGKVWGVAGAVLQGAWCLLAPHNPPAPFFRRLESLLLPPMPQPSCAAQACDGRKELLEVLVAGDFLPSRTSPAVLVGRDCGRGWADGGREGRSASRQS